MFHIEHEGVIVDIIDFEALENFEPQTKEDMVAIKIVQHIRNTTPPFLKFNFRSEAERFYIEFATYVIKDLMVRLKKYNSILIDEIIFVPKFNQDADSPIRVSDTESYAAIEVDFFNGIFTSNNINFEKFLDKLSEFGKIAFETGLIDIDLIRRGKITKVDFDRLAYGLDSKNVH